jgi:predicted nucleic acid-binding protein
VPAYYIDTSALVKRYHHERGSERVDDIFRNADASFLAANLALSELTSALDRKFLERQISQETLTKVLSSIARDLAEEFWLVEVDRTHILHSQELILRHHLRALDSLHLAVALGLRTLAPIVVSADARLLEAAQREQLAVLNPMG